MEQNLKYIRKILKDLKYSDTYIDILLKEIIQKFNESGLDTITPNFIYYSLVYNEGKETARKISDYFSQMQETGDYISYIDRLSSKY